MRGLLRICACAVVALALVQVAYLAARAPSAVASMTPADGMGLIDSLPLLVGESGAPSSDAAESPHEHSTHEHGIDPVSAALLALDGLVVLTVIVLLARRPRPRRTAGWSTPRRSREPDPAEPAEHPYVPVKEREDTGDFGR
jgi:hypothetical protein